MSDGQRPTILTAAFSARQIATSARLAGIDALAVDFFSDLDLAEHAKRCEVLHGEYPDGFSSDDLLAALERLSAGETPIGFVYGAGFEDRPELLEEIGRSWPILGTSPEISRQLKDPKAFAEICLAAGVAHPDIRFQPPEDPENWLSKKIGGSGGSHVRFGDAPAAPDRYYQRFEAGERISLAFVANGGEHVPLGYTGQWTDPSEDEPFRYAGAVGPLPAPPAWDEEMRSAIAAILSRLPLLGLCSADFVLTERGHVLLEINARAGATLDIFEDERAPLVRMHLDACEGRLPGGSPPKRETIRAAGLAWAAHDITVPAGFDWPDWTRDRSRPPARFRTGDPLCTIVAEADDVVAAVGLFTERAHQINEVFGRIAA